MVKKQIKKKIEEEKRKIIKKRNEIEKENEEDRDTIFFCETEEQERISRSLRFERFLNRELEKNSLFEKEKKLEEEEMKLEDNEEILKEEEAKHEEEEAKRKAEEEEFLNPNRFKN